MKILVGHLSSQEKLKIPLEKGGNKGIKYRSKCLDKAAEAWLQTFFCAISTADSRSYGQRIRIFTLLDGPRISYLCCRIGL